MHYLKLCLVTSFSNQSFSSYKDFLLRAVEGGVTSVQLRAKGYPIATLLKWAIKLKSVLTPVDIPLIINDHVTLAAKTNAFGVHIGQSDLSPSFARELLGENKIIGWSIEDFAQLEIANTFSGIDYIAASAVFPSKTKPDCKTIWGLAGLKKITELANKPVIAIGGIDLNNIAEVMSTGVHGVAVVSAIHDHPDPKKAAEILRTQIDSKR